MFFKNLIKKKTSNIEEIENNILFSIYEENITIEELSTIIARIIYDTGVNNITIIEYTDYDNQPFYYYTGRKIYRLATKTKEEYEKIKSHYNSKYMLSAIIKKSPYKGIVYKSCRVVKHDDGSGFSQYIPIPSPISSIENNKKPHIFGDLKIKDTIKRVCIFYHNDHDGIFSARLAYEYINNVRIVVSSINNFVDDNPINKYMPIDMIPINDYSVDLEKEFFKYYKYDSNNKEYSYYENTLFIFLDYSFTNIINIRWLDKLCLNTDVVWIDHHVNSYNFYNTAVYPNIKKSHRYFNIKYCGAVNTYQYLYGETEIPKILQYIDSYDTWKHNMPNTQEFHYGLLVGSPKDEFFKNKNWLTDESIVYECIDRGKLFLNMYDFENKSIHLDYSFEFKIVYKSKTYNCLAINRKGPSRMFLDNILKYDIVCPWYYNGEVFIYSLYSDKSKDSPCGEIATALGGGGHPRAAGFQNINLIIDKDSVLNVKDGDN